MEFDATGQVSAHDVNVLGKIPKIGAAWPSSSQLAELGRVPGVPAEAELE